MSRSELYHNHIVEKKNSLLGPAEIESVMGMVTKSKKPPMAASRMAMSIGEKKYQINSMKESCAKRKADGPRPPTQY
jgi:hypothetical protein